MKYRKWLRLLIGVISLSMLLGVVSCNTSGGDTPVVSESQELTSTQESENENSEGGSTGSKETTLIETTEETISDSSEETVETTEEKNSEVTETQTTEETEVTTETETETFEQVYSYNFYDDSWKGLFDLGGGATRVLADDPAGSGEKVLAVSHNSSQTASWIRNKNAFDACKHTEFSVEVDLYIPSSALSDAGDYVQMQINGEYNHHVNLVSDAKENLSAFDTKDFPRDKWFIVRFSIDMTKLKYDLEILEDGERRAVVFSGRSAASLAQTGPLNLRVFLGGKDQTIYMDNHGLEAGSKGGNSGVKSAKFIRIDGINAAGYALSIYGDFAGGAKATDLTDIVWERCDTYSGEYTAIGGANGVTYTPGNGGYYVRVKAKLGKMSFTSAPVYIRDEANCGFLESYLSFKNGTLTAAVVYNNEFDAYNAEIKVVIYEGGKAIKTYSKSFKAKQGSDLVVFSFEDVDLSGKTAKLTVIAGGKTVCEAVEVSDSLPDLKVMKTSEGTTVLANKKQVAYFKQNRYMRFRPSIQNDHWIGTDHNPVDMGFAYQEAGVKGLNNISVESVVAPGVFKVVFIGEKAGLKATQRNELIGFWDEESQSFSFIYNASITADTQTWHDNSSWASQSRIEAFDYNLERMSILDRVYNKNQNGDLYDYVIYENGDELVRIPKLPVPRTAIRGTYFYGYFLSPGESMYFPDAKEGGWEATLLSATGDTYLEICWSWYDIHNCAENSVPQVGNCDSFTVHQSWLYTATNSEHDSELIDDAVEVEWRDIPNYQLPLFSTNNTFETQFGGTDWQYAWWKSTYDCTMDAEVGHNDAGSVKIEKSTSGEASWYTEGVWGYPYSFDNVQGKTYRVSGYIKTENVVGEAYIANIQYQHATPNDNTVTRSEGVTGTSDWVYVSFTFKAQERTMANGSVQRCIDHFFLTLDGTGTVWFDDVIIEEVK